MKGDQNTEEEEEEEDRYIFMEKDSYCDSPVDRMFQFTTAIIQSHSPAGHLIFSTVFCVHYLT